GGDDDDTFQQTDGHESIVTQGTESQGRRLLGAKMDGFFPGETYHANVLSDAVDANGNPITVFVTGSGALISGPHVGTDPFFNGVVFHDDHGAEVMISVSRGGYDVAWYHLQSRGTPADPWVDTCDGIDADDAVPYAGTWSAVGTHALTPGRI